MAEHRAAALRGRGFSYFSAGHKPSKKKSRLFVDGLAIPSAATPATLADQEDARLINDFSIAFLDQYVKGEPRPLLSQGNPVLLEYRHAP
jgi:hypothetical protein